MSMNGALSSLLNAYQQRFQGVDKPQFYNSWQPGADPQMQLTPDSSHPAMNDLMLMQPDDLPVPYHVPSPWHGRQEMSALQRLMLG